MLTHPILPHPNSSPQTHTQLLELSSCSSLPRLVEEDLTSLEPALTTLFCCWSPEDTTTSPLLPWVRLGSQGTSAAQRGRFPTDGSRAGKGVGKEDSLPSSQQRLLNHWLVAPQETPGHAHLDRHVPSQARQIHPLAHATSSWPQLGRRGGCQAALCAGWGLLWPFLKVKGLSHPGLIQPGLAPV